MRVILQIDYGNPDNERDNMSASPSKDAYRHADMRLVWCIDSAEHAHLSATRPNWLTTDAKSERPPPQQPEHSTGDVAVSLLRSRNCVRVLRMLGSSGRGVAAELVNAVTSVPSKHTTHAATARRVLRMLSSLSQGTALLVRNSTVGCGVARQTVCELKSTMQIVFRLDLPMFIFTYAFDSDVAPCATCCPLSVRTIFVTSPYTVYRPSHQLFHCLAEV